MKKIFLFAIIVCLASIASAQVELPRPSPRASVMQRIGVTVVTITYSRPGVKNRVIWGELVPYDKVWRTGANEATTISFSNDVKIEGENLPAGTYALFTIPGKTEWTIIFNKAADQWGSNDYKQEQDALRVKVKPAEGPDEEWMNFVFRNLSLNSADVVFRWANLEVQFGIQTDTLRKVMADCRAAMKDLKADDDRTPRSCAQFAAENNGDPAEALQWVGKSISMKEGFANLATQARLQAKIGKKSVAIQTAKKALTLAKDAPANDVENLKKEMQEWSGN